jgi:cytochrome c oxidase subunit 3
LFVVSEFFLFVSAFGVYLNLRLNLSNFGLYSVFPVFPTIAFSLPFSNLFILLTSGFPLSSSQIFSKTGNLEMFLFGMFHTLSASLLFIGLQLKEFTYSYFSLYDNIIGSIFYFTVGTHGSHVIIGSLFIYYILIASSLPIAPSPTVIDIIDLKNVVVKKSNFELLLKKVIKKLKKINKFIILIKINKNKGPKDC